MRGHKRNLMAHDNKKTIWRASCSELGELHGPKQNLMAHGTACFFVYDVIVFEGCRQPLNVSEVGSHQSERGVERERERARRSLRVIRVRKLFFAVLVTR